MVIKGFQVVQGLYILYEASKEELWFQLAEQRISQAIARDQWLKASEIATEWAGGVCDRFGLGKTSVWKFFKRSVVARWFGRVENRRFRAGWSVEEALQYANTFPGRSVRFSLFPEDIACHATSFRLPVDQKDRWERIIGQADNSVGMEMFPEASTADSICFRRYSTQFGEKVIYEAGKGQAMFVFEQERGQHPVVSAEKRHGKYVYSEVNPRDGHSHETREIGVGLRDLIERHDDALSTRCSCLCRALGIDYVSVEGYFDPTEPGSFVIVDLDLPFDFVFMASKSFLSKLV